jgi:hypothetical protein
MTPNAAYARDESTSRRSAPEGADDSLRRSTSAATSWNASSEGIDQPTCRARGPRAHPHHHDVDYERMRG